MFCAIVFSPVAMVMFAPLSREYHIVPALSVVMLSNGALWGVTWFGEFMLIEGSALAVDVRVNNRDSENSEIRADRYMVCFSVLPINLFPLNLFFVLL